jgi:hypothetical protein
VGGRVSEEGFMLILIDLRSSTASGVNLLTLESGECGTSGKGGQERRRTR